MLILNEVGNEMDTHNDKILFTPIDQQDGPFTSSKLISDEKEQGKERNKIVPKITFWKIIDQSNR